GEPLNTDYELYPVDMTVQAKPVKFKFLKTLNKKLDDLEDLNGDDVRNELDLDGDGIADIDLDGDGIMDIDLNSDGKSDSLIEDVNGDGVPEIDLSKDGTVDWNYIPEKWTNRKTQLYAKWLRVMTAKEYHAGAGTVADRNNLTDIMATGGWLSTRTNKRTISNLSLSEAKVTRLSFSVSRLQTVPFDLNVESTDGFPSENGIIYVGSEIMFYTTKSQNQFHVTQRALYNTQAQDHPAYTKVSNYGYYYRIRAMSQTNVLGPETALMLYRVDITPPKSPGAPISDQERTGKEITEGLYTIEWSPASDAESGVRAYEIQERVDTNPVWKTIRVVGAQKTSLTIGNNDVPTNAPRPKGRFYYYRVRAQNYAGTWSEWSEISKPASTGLPEEVISQVSNYPNPVDTRRGGEEGKTHIVYVLNQDAEVTITIFDLLGYKVTEWTYKPGEEGGRKGANKIPPDGWAGVNQSGQKVAKGGYIAQIKVKSDRGVITAIRKIGIIR
ncbi:MAG: fibronectin type III domain-containing protein, partial [Endomicrobiia bacterium]